MTKKIAVVVVLLGFVVTLMAAPENSRHSESTGANSAASTVAVPDKALMQKIWDAWATMNPDNAAQFYDKEPNDVFFDIAPVKYEGWANYSKGAANVIQQSFTALKFTVNDDARVQNSAAGALGIATIDAVLTGKDGKTQHMTLRWTVIWTNENGRWLVIHEHVSAPLS
jgi:ketosteroid isomerase-like protein